MHRLQKIVVSSAKKIFDSKENLATMNSRVNNITGNDFLDHSPWITVLFRAAQIGLETFQEAL